MRCGSTALLDEPVEATAKDTGPQAQQPRDAAASGAPTSETGHRAPSGLHYPGNVGPTVTILLLAAAVGLVCLGMAIGVALSRRRRNAATSAADLAGLAGTDTTVPVLAALRSTVVVLDDDDEVLRASAAAYTFNIVRDDAVVEPTVAVMVNRVRASGQAQDAAVTVARGRVPGAGQFHRRMRKEARRLGVLVQEIIELTRLQEGDALAEPEVVDIDDVVAEAVDRVRVEADGSQIDLVTGGTQGLRVRGDSALITTAVRNLLDNAIRYSEPRTRVSVGVSLDPEHSDIVRIAVVDQGIGIPKEEQERVFERFYRVDKARSRATGGTGLGLSIVKHVAADHGGTVELWSAPGRGSTFTLVLPRLPEGESGHHEPAAGGSGEAGAADDAADQLPRSAP